MREEVGSCARVSAGGGLRFVRSFVRSFVGWTWAIYFGRELGGDSRRSVGEARSSERATDGSRVYGTNEMRFAKRTRERETAAEGGARAWKSNSR